MVFGTQLDSRKKTGSRPSFPAPDFISRTTKPRASMPRGNLLPDAGNAYASYLLGEVDNSLRLWTLLAFDGLRFRHYALYVQDDWKATRV